MKLSEISGERVFDVIADITDPICNIVSDDAVKAAFRDSKGDGDTGGAEALRGVVPLILGTHRDDLVTILASIEGTDPKEYAETITLPKLLASVYDILTDEELLSFLA